MSEKKLFDRHRRRLVGEGVLRSLLFGLSVGFGVNFLLALAGWIFGFGGIWLPISSGVGVAIISGLLIYFLKFKPSEKETAKRVDRLGLEERMITMLELKDNDSYIASLQRENARTAATQAQDRRIRIRIPRMLIVSVITAAIIGSSMTTVAGLAANDVIPGGDEIIPDALVNHIPVTYMVEEGGEILGEAEQLIIPGESTTPVIAQAEDGWVFVGWDDGVKSLERFEKNVTTEMVITAIFENIFEDGDSDSEADGEGKPGSGEEGDEADDLPAGSESNADSDSQGGNGDKGDGSGSDGENDGGQGSSEEQGGEGKGDGQGLGAGGKWEESNQFKDGNTYYRDQLESYYQQALEIFEQNGEIPPELREFFETYFDSI